MRYSQAEADIWPYAAVGCVFNHQQLYANQQEEDDPTHMSFCMEDPISWCGLEMMSGTVPAPLWCV